MCPANVGTYLLVVHVVHVVNRKKKKKRKKEKEEKGTLFKKIKKERGLLVQPLVCVFFKSTTVVKVESRKQIFFYFNKIIFVKIYCGLYHDGTVLCVEPYLRVQL